MLKQIKFHTATPDWRGQPAFVIGGGSSFAAVNVERLRGCNVIALNKSMGTVPFAQYGFFADHRFWHNPELQQLVLKFGPGRALGIYPVCQDARVTYVRRSKMPGPSFVPDTVAFEKTVMTAGINWAMHMGANPIVLMGADGRQFGKKHHHHADYPWPVIAGCWNRQRLDLQTFVEPLKARGIEVLNASPGSAWNMWPIVEPDSVLPALPAQIMGAA